MANFLFFFFCSRWGGRRIAYQQLANNNNDDERLSFSHYLWKRQNFILLLFFNAQEAKGNPT